MEVRLRNIGKKEAQNTCTTRFYREHIPKYKEENYRQESRFSETGKKHRETQRNLLKSGNTSEIR